MTFHSENQLSFIDFEDEVEDQDVEVVDGKGENMDIPPFPIARCSEKQALESYESLQSYDFTNLIAREKWS